MYNTWERHSLFTVLSKPRDDEPPQENFVLLIDDIHALKIDDNFKLLIQ